MQPKSIILFFYGYILFFRRHQTTKNLINKEIDIKVELLTKSMAIALGDLIKDVDDEKEKIKISLPQLKILDLKRIKADTFLSIKKQPSKPILLEKT
ncbi:hypothetical protein ACM1CR_001746 [Campylobacter coli]